jgi:dephospho-CoA kinase
MIKVGLTGNLFSGQDQVGKIFKYLNVKVFDADLMLRYFINFSPEHIKKIKANFGDNSYSLGTLNIDLFRGFNELESLLDIIEFDILIAYAKFRLEHKDETYTIFKYSYLFERELETDFDYCINVTRPKYLRDRDLKRLTRIPTISINNILNGEMTEKKKNNIANFVITNNDETDVTKSVLTSSQVYNQVKKLDNTITRKIPQVISGDL